MKSKTTFTRLHTLASRIKNGNATKRTCEAYANALEGLSESNPAAFLEYFHDFVGKSDKDRADCQTLLIQLGTDTTHGDLRRALEAEQQRIIQLVQQ